MWSLGQGAKCRERVSIESHKGCPQRRVTGIQGAARHWLRSGPGGGCTACAARQARRRPAQRDRPARCCPCPLPLTPTPHAPIPHAPVTSLPHGVTVAALMLPLRCASQLCICSSRPPGPARQHTTRPSSQPVHSRADGGCATTHATRGGRGAGPPSSGGMYMPGAEYSRGATSAAGAESQSSPAACAGKTGDRACHRVLPAEANKLTAEQPSF